MQARHLGSCKLPQSVSGEDQRQSHCQEASGEREIQKEPKPRTSGENPRQNHSRRASGGKKIKEQQRSSSSRGERLKRTEKSRANSRQKSRANSRREKSIANGKQGEPKDCDRDEAKYEENTAQRKDAASQSQMSSRGNTSQQGRYELKLGEVIMTIPSADVPVAKQRREDTTRRHDEVQRNPDGQEAAFSIAQDRKQEAICLRL